MPTIDLTTPPAVPEGTLERLPRRVSLTLAELRLLAERAGGAPLPFEVVEAAAVNPLESKLGQTRLAADDQAYADAVASLHDPADALARRGLLVDGEAEAGVVGALGLLATPAVAVDLDLAVGQARARAWHRQRGGAVATLATADGVVFELAWFDSPQWAAELARVAAVPEDVDLETPGSHPEGLDAPYELLDAATEAVRTGRTDLIPTIVAHHSGSVLGADGAPLDDAATTSLVTALATTPLGRLRAMAADIDAGGTVVGVVSWVLLPDGWRWLRPHQDADAHRVEVRRVQPDDLALALGPVLAEVTA